MVNGVLAAQLMAVMMAIAMNPRIMGRLTLPRPMRGRMAGNIGHDACNSRVLLDLNCVKQTGMDYVIKPSSRCHPG